MRLEIFRKYLNVCYKNLEKLYHIHFTGFNDSFIDLWSESHSVVSTSHKGSLRTLEWLAYPFSSGSSWPRNLTEISCIAGGFFINWSIRGTLAAQLVKNLPADLGLISVLGGSPGEGKGYPLYYSGLENSLDCLVHGVTKSRTWQRFSLSLLTCNFCVDFWVREVVGEKNSVS